MKTHVMDTLKRKGEGADINITLPKAKKRQSTVLFEKQTEMEVGMSPLPFNDLLDHSLEILLRDDDPNSIDVFTGTYTCTNCFAKTSSQNSFNGPKGSNSLCHNCATLYYNNTLNLDTVGRAKFY